MKRWTKRETENVKLMLFELQCVIDSPHYSLPNAAWGTIRDAQSMIQHLLSRAEALSEALPPETQE